MRAFVTGGTGFVGRHLVHALVEHGASVTALVRSRARGEPLVRLGARLVEGDLSAVPDLARHVAGHDVIFHVAGLIAARNDAEFLAVNRDCTRALVLAAHQAGAGRFVYVSSLAAGGPSTSGAPLLGNEPPRPVTRYGRSKLAGEEIVQASALDWTIVRPPAVYGPFDREMLRLFRAASLGVAPVFGDGSLLLSMVYGPDLAAALVAAGTEPRTRGRTFYAAHPEIISSRELVALIGRAVGRRVRIVRIPRPLAHAALTVTAAAARVTNRATLLHPDKANEFFQQAWICDPGPLTEATGWRAAIDLEQGTRATADWYRERTWL